MEQESREKRKKVICDLISDPMYVPMKEKELACILQVGREDREEFHRLLDELLSENRLMLTLKGRYQKSNGSVLTGTFISNVKGFGFVEVEGQDEDYYIPEDKVNGAFHKDLVEIKMTGTTGGKRKEAQVIRVLERGITQLVGTYQASGNFGFVVPDNKKLPCDIFIPIEKSKGAVSGHKVLVELTSYGGGCRSVRSDAEKVEDAAGGRNPEGRVMEILGHINDPGVDILSVVYGYELPTEFGERVLNQAQRVAKEVSEADIAGRRDLRKWQMVTIDGEDAKDLDDAVSLTFDGEVYQLGVHIADVTNYVQENSALDREALKRGTSVYLVDRVIPMLPHALSNGICSLNEGVDRLALSCIMTVGRNGEIRDYEIVESVIRVNHRMSYTIVNAILTEENVYEKHPEYVKYEYLDQMFHEMAQLSAALRERRHDRGAIDFDFPEAKILLDESGHPTDVLLRERNVATMLIEDFMLAANETIAQHFYWQELPFVYRVHDTPDSEKLRRLSTFINNFGYYLKRVGQTKGKVSGEEVHPKEIQKLLKRIEGTPEEAMISRMTLRSMKQAKYSVEAAGHFGLATRYYCHFTSPIRRYPDLQIHRIIKDSLRGRLGEERIEHYRQILAQVAKQSSDTERRAEEAERETDRLKKAEYMEDHIGEEYEGVISGITAWGLYVELPSTVEGLVHVSRLEGDFYYYRQESCELVGEATGRTFKLGMKVRVKVAGSDRTAGTVDFELLDVVR